MTPVSKDESMKTRFSTARMLGGAMSFALFAAGAAFAQTTNEWVKINGHDVHPTRLIVKFKDEVSGSTKETRARQFGEKVKKNFKLMPRVAVLDEDGSRPGLAANAESRRSRLQGRIDALKQSGQFEYVEPDYIVQALLEPTDQAFTNGTLWGLRNIGVLAGVPGVDISATNAWDITTGSTNVIVGVIDTGIRYTHRDLTNQMWRNLGEIPGNGIDDDGNGWVDDVYGINAALNTGNPIDVHEHGTHVAGTIGAAANDGNPHVGVNWNVRLMALKFLNPFGAISDAIECIDYGVAHGAKVLNNSWGGGGYSQALYDAIDRARAAGVLFVVAAGNSASDNDIFPQYPANYDLPNVISVAAIDRQDQLASFSCFGSTTVDLGAPGVSIYSSVSTGDTNYALFQGTSMACPHVAGVAALILAKFPGADYTEVRERLLLGTVPTPALDGRCVTGGRVNAYNSLTLTGSGLLSVSINPPNGSFVLASSVQPVVAAVTDPPFSVIDATVSGNASGVGALTFANDGIAPDQAANDKFYSANLAVPASTNTPVTVTVVANAPGKTGVTNTVQYIVVPPPPNDHFTNAIKLTGVGAIFQSNNRFGTIETSEPYHASVTNRAASLWWAWTATANTNVFLDTSGSGIDTIIAVYTGNNLAALVPVASSDNIGPRLQAQLSFNATAGVTYRIAVCSASTNSTGSLLFRITPGGGPDITAPLAFINSPLNGTIVTSNLVTISGTATDPAPNASGLSEVQLSVAGVTGASVTGTTNWSGVVSLSPGLNMIQARAVDASANIGSPSTIYVTYYVPGPTNDFFANAVALNPVSGSSAANTTSATKEVGEPNHSSNSGGKSVWWKYTAPQDGVLTVSTIGSGFDTLMGLYQGSGVSTLTTIASNDDSPLGGTTSLISQAVKSNQTYYIAVDGFDGVSGDASITNFFSPTPVFLVTAVAGAGGTVSPASTYVASGGSVTLTASPVANYLFDLWSGSFSSLNNPLTVTVTSNMSFTAAFRAEGFTDGFESGTFTNIGWTFAGNQPWIITTSSVAAGNFAARSGFIGHSQTSSLKYTGNFQAGDVSFSYKVSCEANFDALRFYVDNVLQQSWGGEIGWATHIQPLTAGAHTLEWRYVKDGSLVAGQDAAFLDNVNLPLAVVPSAVFKANLQIRTTSDGTKFLDLTGQPNQTYVFQASGDAVNWQSFATNVATGGFIRVVDPYSSLPGRSFYRAYAKP